MRAMAWFQQLISTGDLNVNRSTSIKKRMDLGELQNRGVLVIGPLGSLSSIARVIIAIQRGLLEISLTLAGSVETRQAALTRSSYGIAP